ncbi:MAG: neutral/alkaline non-lysosomal ceramidase N-terminal domain-containing protein [Fimbriimonadaceae bacterium]
MVALVAALLLTGGPVFRTATIDVSPPELLPLGGYTSRGDSVMQAGGDPLLARAVVFEDGGERIALVSLDALTIPESLVSAVKMQIPEGVGLLLVATHTHSAPDSQMLNERMTFKVPGIAGFSRRWLDWYSQKIASCVNAALSSEARDASTLRLSSVSVSANRGRREGTVPIKTATFLLMNGTPLLTTYAAHATVFGDERKTTSGDWPSAVASQLGGIVLPGAIGDASPDSPSKDPMVNIGAIVEKMRAGLSASVPAPLFERHQGVSFVTVPIALGKPVPHPAFATEFGAPSPLDQVLVGRFAPTESTLTLVRIGSLVLVGVPGEPTSDIGRKVQALGANLGFPNTVVVSHANGWIGYVLEPEDYDRGGYEAALSFHGRETSQRVIVAAEAGLKKLAQPTLLTATR